MNLFYQKWDESEGNNSLLGIASIVTLEKPGNSPENADVKFSRPLGGIGRRAGFKIQFP
jgi:hypothetical protein